MAVKSSGITPRRKSSLKSKVQPAVEDAAAEAPHPQAAASERKPTKKQAVVIVHGMGEQKPLETLRGFVRAVWGADPLPSDEPKPEDVWLVPDTRAGLKELARITTRKNDEGVRTDFYELYWSDLMVGNTLSHLRGWATGLLWRWPHQVPKETAHIWLILWDMLIVVIGLFAYIGFNPWETIKKTYEDYIPLDQVWNAGLGLLLALVVAGLLSLRLKRMLELAPRDAAFFGIWAEQTPQKASVPAIYSGIAILVFSAGLGYAAYEFFPWALMFYPRVWAAILALLLIWSMSLAVPIFGDVARYVSTAPSSVAARAEIRERGIKLLRDLHGVVPEKESARAQYDPGDQRDYDRIVLVGHSLGSIVAYDVLRLFWQELGPAASNPPSAETTSRLEALNTYLKSCSPEARPSADETIQRDLSIPELRSHQARIGEALSKQKHGWRITDFVTLGSPLSHSEFLVSRDRGAFEERKAERMFPTCPPAMEPHKAVEDYSYLYGGDAGTPRLPHHGAAFAATRWTNIFDPSPWLLTGDFISGPCGPNFGPGVLDLPVTIYRDSLLKRVFTHTSYWDDRATAVAAEETLAKLQVDQAQGGGQNHIDLLRAALALK